MTDYTAEVAELEAAFRANKIAGASIAADVRAKYRPLIAREIETLKAENDLRFARHLKEVKERSGLPLHVIQDDILHTRTWSAWTKWRDLAQIEPERVVQANHKDDVRRANAPATWDLAEGLFYIRKDKSGADIKPPVAFRVDSIRRPAYDRTKWYADSVLPESEVLPTGAQLMLHEVIQAAFDDGTLDNKEV